MQLRKPAVAGSFYPAQPDQLRRQVAELLTDARTAAKITPRALIAPHAGYIYSGRVAALAFATLFDSAPTFARIVLIGPAHYIAIRGVAFPTIDAFETPWVTSRSITMALMRLSVCRSFRGTMRRMRWNTRSKFNCHFCRLCCHRSRCCRLSSVTPPRTKSHRCWRDCGAAQKHCSSSAPTCLTITVMRPRGAWMRRPLRL